MAVVNYSSPRFSAEADNGGPLAAGKLYTYAAGTTTPQATYSDYLGATPNANPVILNARGEAVVYLTDGSSYKFVLKDSSDATIWTDDNVTNPASTLKADLASNSSPKGSELIASRAYDSVNVNLYKWIRGNEIVAGKPADGIFSTINDALLEAQARGKRLDFCGDWTTSTTLIIKNTDWLQGHGSGNTSITAASGLDAPVLKTLNADALLLTGGTGAWLTSAGVVYGFHLKNFRINGNKANQTNAAARGVLAYAKRFFTEDLIIHDCYGDGWYSQAGNIAGQTDYTDMPEGMVSLWSRNNGGHGVVWRGGHDSVLKQINTLLNTGDGIRIESATNYSGGGESLVIHSYANGENGILLDGPPVRAGTWISESNNKSGIIFRNVVRAQIEKIQTYLNGQTGANTYWDVDFESTATDNMIGQIRSSVSEAGMAGGIRINGAQNQIGLVTIAASAPANDKFGLVMDADGIRIMNARIQAFNAGTTGTGLRTNNTATRANSYINFHIANCDIGWNNVNAGRRCKYYGNIIANAGGQVLFTGTQPRSDKTEDWNVEGVDNGGTTYQSRQILTGTVDLNTTAEQSFTLAHTLLTTPRIDDITIRMDGSTVNTTYAIQYARAISVTATDVVVKVKLSTAAGAAVTANLRVGVSLNGGM